MENTPHKPRFAALLPFLAFVVFYLGLSLWANDFYKVSMPIAFLVASMVAMFLNFKEPLSDKIDVYAKGMGDTNIMIMCLIFVLAGIFASVAKAMGAVDAAVLIARNLIPNNLLVIGMFLVSCFISLAIGTSCGTIAALTPIACGLVEPLGIAPGLLLGAVIGGAMFGDNLSMISDTTIAATRTQGVQMRDKFFTNIRIVIPALIISLVLYGIMAHNSNPAEQGELAPITGQHILCILPYVLLLVCALCGLNVMMLLFFGAVLSMVIGIYTSTMDFWGALGAAGAGALGMSETLLVAILAGGLMAIIRYNGGIEFLLNAIKKGIRGPRACEAGIMLLVWAINLFTANNTVAIVIAGPIAKELSDNFGCSPKRVASILDTASCVIQGALPYGAQLLIAAGLAKESGLEISALQLIGSLYYPMALCLMLLLSIAFFRQKR